MDKFMVFFLLVSFSLSLIGMEHYRRKRDEILQRTYPNDELGQASDQYKNSLLSDYQRKLHNTVAMMHKDEENPAAVVYLCVASFVSFLAWDVYSKTPRMGFLESSFCISAGGTCCLATMYGVADVCYQCFKRRCAQQLKRVDDLTLERDTLLHQD